MNIFVLDKDIRKCAEYHCDQHVVKMIRESAQLMCTAMNKKGMHTPYKSAHANHPCVLWVERSFENFLWLKVLATALNESTTTDSTRGQITSRCPSSTIFHIMISKTWA